MKTGIHTPCPYAQQCQKAKDRPDKLSPISILPVYVSTETNPSCDYNKKCEVAVAINKDTDKIKVLQDLQELVLSAKKNSRERILKINIFVAERSKYMEDLIQSRTIPKPEFIA